MWQFDLSRKALEETEQTEEYRRYEIAEKGTMLCVVMQAPAMLQLFDCTSGILPLFSSLQIFNAVNVDKSFIQVQ